MRNSFLIAIAALGCASLLTSCGGSHNANATVDSTSGRATTSIKWPARNARVIPTAANSIVVTLIQGSKTIASSGAIARPASGGTSTWTTPQLPIGTYTIGTKAFPNADGSGTAQASGAGTIAISNNATSQASVTMGSTVSALTSGPGTILARPNLSLNVSATAKNSTGDIVLVADSDITWKIADPSVIQLVTGGAQAQFKGLKLGSTTVTCTFNGTDASLGQVPVSGQPSLCTVSTPGPAATGWPTVWGNAHGIATTAAPAATGQLAWSMPIGNTQSGVMGVGPDGTTITFSQQSPTTGVLTALNLDGSTKWTFSCPPYPVTEFASDGSLYVAQGSALDVLNPADGSLITSYPTAVNCEFTLGLDGTIYWYSPSDNSLHALDPSGTNKWTLPMNVIRVPRPTIGLDGTIYLISDSHNTAKPTDLTAISPAGAVLWSAPLALSNVHLCTIACGGDGTVYAIGVDGVAAFTQSGTSKWWSSPVFNALGGNLDCCIDSKGFLYTVGYADPSKSWPSAIWKTDPATGANAIVFEDATGQSNVTGGIAITSADVIYCSLSTNGTGPNGLYAIDTSGNVLWTVSQSPGGYISSGGPMIAPDGSVYSTGTQQNIIKISGTGSNAERGN